LKYTPEQKEKILKKGLSLIKLRYYKPIKVEIKDGFYIIESKMNL